MNTDVERDTIERLNDAFGRVTYHRDPTQFAGLRGTRPARHRKAWTVVAVAAAGALTAGGMAAARRDLPDAVSYATDVRSTQQAAELADDHVTLDEYKAAFQRFADCMARDDRPLAEVSFNPTTELYWFVYDGVDDCYNQEFYAIDLVWQWSAERPRDPLHPDISLDEFREACAADDLSMLVGVPQEAFDSTCAWLESTSSTPTTGSP